MKNRKRRLLCGVLCAVMLFASAGSVLAVSCTNYSDWFKPSYNEMNELNLIPSEFSGYDLKKNITRGEMSVLAVHAYGLITKNAIELERTDYFSDTTDKAILEAYELGIVSGYPDGTFRPDQYLTRQEFFKIIQNSATRSPITRPWTARISRSSTTPALFPAGPWRLRRSASSANTSTAPRPPQACP